MRDLLRSTTARVAVVAGVALAGSTAAFGFPWDIDMADSQTVKAYERQMSPVPAGTVSQPNVLTPLPHVANYALGAPETNALTNPLPPDAEVLATGERMFGIYCTPCHGNGVVLGPVSKQYPGIAVLAGDAPAARLRNIPDSRLYVTIRNGFGLMPAYGWAMNDTEMWALVHYARTLPNSAYTPPAPPPQEAPQ